MLQKITPFLWFNNNALEAAEFYTSIFKNSKITSSSPMSITFELDGQNFYALNGGPQFTFTEAISLFVTCENQEEVDYFWEKFISNGGKESRCGWLKDKFGLSWQIIPKNLHELLGKDKTGKVMEAMLKMNKIEVKLLEEAYEGK